MKTAWKNLGKSNPDKAADIKEALADGRNAFKFLTELLEDRMRAAYADQRRDNYDIENWSLKQADTNGRLRTLKEVIDLLQGIDK